MCLLCLANCSQVIYSSLFLLLFLSSLVIWWLSLVTVLDSFIFFHVYLLQIFGLWLPRGLHTATLESESVSCSVVSDSWDPMDYSKPGFSVHGILQERILECVAILFSRGYSQPRDQAQASCTQGRFFTIWVTRENPTASHILYIYTCCSRKYEGFLTTLHFYSIPIKCFRHILYLFVLYIHKSL